MFKIESKSKYMFLCIMCSKLISKYNIHLNHVQFCCRTPYNLILIKSFFYYYYPYNPISFFFFIHYHNLVNNYQNDHIFLKNVLNRANIMVSDLKMMAVKGCVFYFCMFFRHPSFTKNIERFF